MSTAQQSVGLRKLVLFDTIASVRRVTTYFKEVKFEMSKVVWPSREQVAKLTTLVVVISAIVGFYVSGLDYIFTELLTKAIN